VAALDQGDSFAASNLLRRVVALLAGDERAALPWRLLAGEAIGRSGSAPEANAFLIETRQTAERLGDRRAAAVADAVRLHIRASLAEPLRELVLDAERLRQELKTLGDDAGLARATIELAKAQFWAGRAGIALELADEVSAMPGAPTRVQREALSWTSGFAFWGPTPVADALAVSRARLADPAIPPLVAVRAARNQGALLAMLGQFDESRRTFDWALGRHAELGDPILLASLKGHFMGPSAFLAGDAEEAAEMGIESYDQLMSLGHGGFANTSAGGAARALLSLERDDEAEAWADRALAIGGDEDIDSAGPALGVKARVQARRGDIQTAIDTARHGVGLFFDGADHLIAMGNAHADLAEVLWMAGQRQAAKSELQEALSLFERKGDLVRAGHVRDRMAAWEREGAD
jgi:tetratricopeptide (TPR) repeat protein